MIEVAHIVRIWHYGLKGMEKIRTEGLKTLGKGGLATVYILDDERILKLYPPSEPEEDVIREERAAHAAYEAGISTARPYGTVKSGDSTGIIFEWVKGDILADVLMKEWEESGKLEHGHELGAMAGRLLAGLHHTEPASEGLRCTKDIYRRYIGRLDNWYTRDEIDMISGFLDRIPDTSTMVHGDYHTRNLILREGNPVLIDMAELSLGHPVFDLSAVYDLFVLLPVRSPDSTGMFLGLSPDLSPLVWSDIICAYAETSDAERIKKIEKICKDFSLFRIAVSPAIYVNMSDGVKAGRVKRGREEFLANINEHIKTLAEIDEILP